MSNSLNRCMLIGNVGSDPEFRDFANGGRVCNFSLATNETWKDKSTGEKKERVEWHRISVTNEMLCGLIESYVKKGDKLYLSGSLQTRSWEQDGITKYSTEVVLRPYNGELIMLGSRGSEQGGNAAPSAAPVEDEIAF